MTSIFRRNIPSWTRDVVMGIAFNIFVALGFSTFYLPFSVVFSGLIIWYLRSLHRKMVNAQENHEKKYPERYKDYSHTSIWKDIFMLLTFFIFGFFIIYLFVLNGYIEWKDLLLWKYL